MSCELSRATFNVLQAQNNLSLSFTLKEYCVLNTEKQTAPKMLSRSGNFDMAGLVGFSQRKESIDLESQHMGEGQRIFDLENEDNLEIAEQPFDDVNDFFIRAFHSESDTTASCSTLEVGLLEVEFSDSIIRKTIEVFLNGWP